LLISEILNDSFIGLELSSFLGNRLSRDFFITKFQISLLILFLNDSIKKTKLESTEHYCFGRIFVKEFIIFARTRQGLCKRAYIHSPLPFDLSVTTGLSLKVKMVETGID
jgi:hypothetical protein